MRCSVCGRTFILSSFSRSSAGRISLESIFFGVSSTGLAAGQGGGNQLTAPTLDHRLIIRTERLIERTGSLIKGRRTTPANRLNKFPVNWARLSHTTDRGSGGPFHRLGPPPVLAVIYLTAPPPSNSQSDPWVDVCLCFLRALAHHYALSPLGFCSSRARFARYASSLDLIELSCFFHTISRYDRDQLVSRFHQQVLVGVYGSQLET